MSFRMPHDNNSPPAGEQNRDPQPPEISFDTSGIEPDDGYRVSIPLFEGPVDLLLYLIRKNELDIHEISLAEIAREYLEYVELIRMVNLEYAGEFIVVASTLMKIKSRSLFLPQGEDEETREGENERETLIRYLLEYQKLGGAAEKLAEKEAARRGVFPRAGEKSRVVDHYAKRDNAPDYVLFDLMTALRDVLSTAPKITTHEVELINVTSEMKQREIMNAVVKEGKADFLSMVRGQPRIIIVVTFIALLELIKNGKVRIRQTNQFGRIEIYEHSTDEIADS
ncbi:MAG: segregation and condensation protein A [Candidatus Nanopelagicales bacterium]